MDYSQKPTISKPSTKSMQSLHTKPTDDLRTDWRVLAGDNISSAVTLPLLCVLGLCDAFHVDQSSGLIAFGALGAVETPLKMSCICRIDDR